MITQRIQYSPVYAEWIQEIDRELKAQNRRWSKSAATFMLFGGIALLLLMGRNFDYPYSCTGFVRLLKRMRNNKIII